jgi:hypothetical protein
MILSRKNRNKGCGFWDNNYWQSPSFNRRDFQKNMGQIVQLAVNRFRWEGLPDTCDMAFLERTLLEDGVATIAKYEGDWYSLRAVTYGTLDMYGYPVEWRAMGVNGSEFEVNWDSGVLVYNSMLASGSIGFANNSNPWNALELYARDLCHIDRTERMNLMHQCIPWILQGPKEQQQQLANIIKQISGGEPFIAVDEEFSKHFASVEVLNTTVPYIGEQLETARLNKWNAVYTYLGIDNLARKKERMIEDEVSANNEPVTLRALDGLQARRKACDSLEKLGLNLDVVFNDDVESYNWAVTEKISEDEQQEVSIDA